MRAVWIGMAGLVLCSTLAALGRGSDGEAAGAAQPGQGPPAVLPAPPARVRVLAGHATLISDRGAALLTRRSPAVEVARPCFLHVAPGGRAEVRRSGEVSLRVEGPAELEWDPPRAAGAGGVWRLLQATGVDVEVRRGEERLELPSAGWGLRAGGGAFHLATLARGGVSLTHHAGAPLAAAPLAGFVLPPRPERSIEPGAQELLPALERVPVAGRPGP
jgi:hypothetical protein